MTARISVSVHSLHGSDPGDSMPRPATSARVRTPFATVCVIRNPPRADETVTRSIKPNLMGLRPFWLRIEPRRRRELFTPIQSADELARGSDTGSTGPLFSRSASEPSSNSGSFDGSIFRTNSSISLPGLNVTTFLEGT